MCWEVSRRLGDLARARGQRRDRPHRRGPRSPLRRRPPSSGAADDPGDDQQPDPVDRVVDVIGAAPVLDVAGRDAFFEAPRSRSASRFLRPFPVFAAGRVRGVPERFPRPLPATVEDPDLRIVGQHVGAEFVAGSLSVRRPAGVVRRGIRAGRLSTALWTSSLKSSRIREVAIWPIVPPKTSRIARVRPEETAASRQRTGQVRGCTSRRAQAAVLLRAEATISL